ncbi:MAG: nucleoid-associated protein [Bacteroidota bacterium]
MIGIEEVKIRNLIYHYISMEGNALRLSDESYIPEGEEELEVLKKIFLKPFVSSFTTYEFKHEINLELNPLFKLAQSIEAGEDFTAKSKDIVQHLKSVSKHPNIKHGDLFVMKLDNVKIGDKLHQALAIYKIENKESFIETDVYDSNVSGLSFKKGIGSKRPDKACLILFTPEPYTVLIIDNTSAETDYWQNEFLKVNLKKDDINSTSHFLSLAKTYVTEKFSSDFEVTKADQIDLLNRSVDYFKTHATFDKQEFEKEVFQEIGIIRSFQNFDSEYRQGNDIDVTDNFAISPEAVKKQARIFKSVLKLDKNFHIYIHGNRDLIEQGVDEKGRKYYKIYFEQES